jgi:hypothetical protein
LDQEQVLTLLEFGGHVHCQTTYLFQSQVLRLIMS